MKKKYKCTFDILHKQNYCMVLSLTLYFRTASCGPWSENVFSTTGQYWTLKLYILSIVSFDFKSFQQIDADFLIFLGLAIMTFSEFFFFF